MAGDDSITGNGDTRISYTAGFVRGDGRYPVRDRISTAAGDAAGVGIDTFTGVFSVRGSNFDDKIYGASGGPLGFEVFDGLRRRRLHRWAGQFRPCSL